MKNKKLLLIVALILGWLVDLLFWNKPGGISFLIWTVLVLAGGIVLSISERVRISWWSLLLGLLTLAAASTRVIRLEGLTVFLAVAATLGSLWLLALTWRNGYWARFRLRDHFEAGFWAVVAALSRPGELLRSEPVDGDTSNSGWKNFWRWAAPILLGILITLPVLAVLTSLLASADLVFADRVEALLELLDIRRLPEYIFRLIYILALSYFFSGLLLHAVLSKREIARPEPDKPWVRPFLGWTESVILLGSIVALFSIFVGIQFQYLFGGQANISAAGYTFAEYARRGFNELVTIAILTLGIYLLLATISRRDTHNRRRIFSILIVLVFGLVIVMMVSAWLRLAMYEQAYGFTQVRTYTHFFIPWMGALLAAVIILEVVGRRGWTPLALLVLCYGFTFTLAAVNVDGYIARQNIQRAVQGKSLDDIYLSGLSVDAVPVLVEMMQSPDLPEQTRTVLGVDLACRAAMIGDIEPQPWQSYHFSRARAVRLLLEKADLWDGFKARWDEDGWLFVRYGDQKYNCLEYHAFD